MNDLDDKTSDSTLLFHNTISISEVVVHQPVSDSLLEDSRVD